MRTDRDGMISIGRRNGRTYYSLAQDIAVIARSRTLIVETSVPRFPRGTRFRFDAGRKAWIVLAPERLMMPDEIATEVLKLVDGERTVAAIAGELARQFNAARDEVLNDILPMLQELADDTVLEDARPADAEPA